MADAFVKLYKKFLEWEWYSDHNTKALFIHCLLKANWKATRWRGIEIQPGQFITSLPSLSKELKLSVRQVRTSLEHLKSTGEVTDKTYSKYRVITVNNWSEYQTSDRQIDRQATGKRQASDRQATTDKEYKEYKNYKNKKNMSVDSFNKIHDFKERTYNYSELEGSVIESD